MNWNASLSLKIWKKKKRKKKRRFYFNQEVPGSGQAFGPIGTPRVLTGPLGC